MEQKERILVTGASGFIGSFIVERGLELGMEVWASVRRGSSRAYLQDERIHFIEMDMGNRESLFALMRRQKEEVGPWHYVVHAAGATKCRKKSHFERINTEGTRNLADALQETGMTPRRFVFISSLSVYGPVREQAVPPHALEVAEHNDGTGAPLRESVYTPLLPSDRPQPNTAYGRSKLAAEACLRNRTGFPFIVLRPTGVYGPREKDYFLMAKSIRRHIDFSVGYRRQEITFVYVKDLVQAVFLALRNGKTGSGYFVSDGNVYSSRAFSDLLQQSLGVRHVLHVKAPLFVLKAVCAVAGLLSAVTGKASTLNIDKYNIMQQRNWQCDISAARTELGYRPQYDLRRGVREAVDWYLREKWI